MAEKKDDVAMRRKLRRRKIRRRRLAIGFVFFLIFSLAVFAVLSLTVLFPIKHVTASGSKIYSDEEIIKASKITKDDNLFALSESKLEKRLRKKLPYIDTVTINRTLPDTVSIKFKDAKEYACYNVYGKYYVVSDKNFVLGEYNELPQNVFEIRASGVKCKTGEQVYFEKESTYDLANELVEKLRSFDIAINRIDVTNIYNISVRVDSRFDVTFGTKENIDKKIAHLSGMIKNIEKDRTGKINLSMWTSSKSEGSFTQCQLE